MRVTEAIKILGNIFVQPVTLVNASLPDQPLIYINTRFSELTGYEQENILGKNCRFLRGPETDKLATERIRNAIIEEVPICQDLLNFKKNGELFFNRLLLIPFKENSQQFYIGLQHEITREKFKPIHQVSHKELLDKAINPLTVMIGLLSYPNHEMDEAMSIAADRIKQFVLGL